jgi:hypothetical protein
MIQFEQCDPVLAVCIREEALYLLAHEPSRFIDRGKHFVNLGVDGKSGHYYSLRHDAAPTKLRQWLGQFPPKVGGYQLDQAYINIYPAGGFMPIHRDNTDEGHLGMAVIPLQSHPLQGLNWYSDDGQKHFIADELGQAVVFDSLAIQHAVPAVFELRLSTVYLYR